jgi:hypothetical protein
LYSLARPPFPTNKYEENVVIKIGCNIFAIISLTSNPLPLYVSSTYIYHSSPYFPSATLPSSSLKTPLHCLD